MGASWTRTPLGTNSPPDDMHGMFVSVCPVRVWLVPDKGWLCIFNSVRTAHIVCVEPFMFNSARDLRRRIVVELWVRAQCGRWVSRVL